MYGQGSLTLWDKYFQGNDFVLDAVRYWVGDETTGELGLGGVNLFSGSENHVKNPASCFAQLVEPAGFKESGVATFDSNGVVDCFPFGLQNQCDNMVE